MKSKHWKNLWLYVMFTSGSTIWCGTSMEVVKATNPTRQTKQEEFVSKISYLTDSRLKSNYSNRSSSNQNRDKAGDKRSEKKITSLKLQPETIHTNKFQEGQALALQFGSMAILRKDKCMVSQPLSNGIVSKQLPLEIIYQSRQDEYATDQNITGLACLDFSLRNRKLPPKPIQIAQNQEPSPPPPPPENVEQNPPPPPPENVEQNPPPTPASENIEKNPPPLESQPTDFPAPTPSEIDQKLDSLEDESSKRLERLLELIEENKQKQQQSLNSELGTIIVQELPMPAPPDLKQPPPIEKPVRKFKPVGYLLGRVGYFHTSNIFSSRTNAIDDGLIFTGLTLAAAPFKIAPKTYVNGSIDGNIIRYSDQSQFSYNQLRFNLGVYQQLTNRMYGEIGWNNQQLFYAQDSDSDRFNFSSGDKFLNENSFRVSVGRRDPLAPKLNLDSFYEFRLSLTNPPEQRNRMINYIWLSLNYYLQKSLRVGIDYQFNLSNFLERSREDQYHRLSGNLKYGISELSSINLQTGFTLGGSTDRNIDFDGWFFSINYSWDLVQF
ncbi:MAG: hypothetical protein AAFW70_19225 [Cyanobacteria bacterium J06635_10]